jgi:hypothetical protein
MAGDIICKVKCFDGFLNTQVYPRPIKRGEVVEVTEELALRMQRANTGVAIIERKLKLNKRRKQDDGSKT